MSTAKAFAKGYIYFGASGAPKIPYMIYVPGDGMPKPSSRVVVHFHGYTGAKSIDDHVANPPTNLAAAMAKATDILVQPWGGSRSKFGILHTSFSALDSLIFEALGLASDNAPSARMCIDAPFPTKIVLSGHSGGGEALRKTAAFNGKTAGALTEVWALDCMYAFEGDEWVKWAKHHAGISLKVVTQNFLPTNTTGDAKPCQQGRVIEKATLTNVAVSRPPLGHIAIATYGVKNF
jgi:hypothetical protein